VTVRCHGLFSMERAVCGIGEWGHTLLQPHNETPATLLLRDVLGCLALLTIPSPTRHTSHPSVISTLR